MTHDQPIDEIAVLALPDGPCTSHFTYNPDRHDVHFYTAIPEPVAASLVGKRLDALVEHPALHNRALASLRIIESWRWCTHKQEGFAVKLESNADEQPQSGGRSALPQHYRVNIVSAQHETN